MTFEIPALAGRKKVRAEFGSYPHDQRREHRRKGPNSVTSVCSCSNLMCAPKPNPLAGAPKTAEVLAVAGAFGRVNPGRMRVAQTTIGPAQREEQTRTLPVVRKPSSASGPKPSEARQPLATREQTPVSSGPEPSEARQPSVTREQTLTLHQTLPPTPLVWSENPAPTTPVPGPKPSEARRRPRRGGCGRRKQPLVPPNAGGANSPTHPPPAIPITRAERDASLSSFRESPRSENPVPP
jgi:hypothetical protein